MPRLSTHLWAILIAVTVTTPALAAPTPLELVRETIDAQGTVPYTGTRIQLLQRQSLKLKAEMRIFYQDQKDYRVTVQAPDTLEGVNLWLKNDHANLFFPAENLLFRNDNPTGSDEAASTIFGQISTDVDLLQRNYSLRILSDAEEPDNIVALTPCYVLDAVPLRGYVTPAHRFWISKDTFQIMREDRTWGQGLPPYFSSYFDDYVPTPQVDIDVGLPPSNHNTVELKADQQNNFVEYRTVADAEKAIGQQVSLPAYVPAGFKLYAIQFANLFGSRITLLHYTDGLNWLFVSYRPKPNMFLTLMAGAMSLSLVQKLSALSYQAPYNYQGAEKDGQWVYAYGDLYPEDLQKVVNSLTFTSP